MVEFVFEPARTGKTLQVACYTSGWLAPCIQPDDQRVPI